MKKKQIIIFSSIIIFFQTILNILLKHVCYYYSLRPDWIKRPNTKKQISSWYDLGMPSGHTETTTIFCLTLIWYYKFPVKMGLMLILIMMLQRVLTKMHTVRQVIAGFFCGYIYSYIYILTGYSEKTLGFIILMIYTYLKLIQNYISKKMSEIPSSQLEDFNFKYQKQVNIHKILWSVLSMIYVTKCNTTRYEILYLSYERLQRQLDHFINTTNMADINIVIGIKTGGVIMGKYIANKLKKPYYSIQPKYETILEDISNKKVLLIDNIGKNMNTVIKYLKDKKQVKFVYPYVYNSSNKFPSISDNYIYIWPWGYDS